ncbi:hypothetical protein EYF80_043647 [Liparis tanakae]|uniref:Uncharacterized protein n=1 Tax=Liparis tanakae TaxID=230148 RepID=A0A4Z2G0V4_9TELE|nr:hypothetical protein EYF80_043647 [Liparis tanakae]
MIGAQRSDGPFSVKLGPLSESEGSSSNVHPISLEETVERLICSSGAPSSETQPGLKAETSKVSRVHLHLETDDALCSISSHQYLSLRFIACR